MKVLPFKIPKPDNEALVYQEERLKVLYDQLHQHSEIQISYVEQGAGTLIVGDTINTFSPGDILVLGGYLPHVFRTDTKFSEETVVYTLFFDKNSFGKHFFDLPDMGIIRDFFNESEYGMKLLNPKDKIIKLFLSLKNQNKVQRISSLLLIIDLITKAEKIALSSFVYKKKYTDDEGKRMNDVFNYSMENYMEPITLENIAEIANMSRNAFCRYFKKRTNKTFFQFLIEIRVEHACKYLYRNPDQSISSISGLCGFQNIANFNRKFKEVKGITPSHYRLQKF